ncbi:MAG TPA: hypothetical protein VMI54_08250 [Polyangiaceae bacterium]|nr:hypothetical protein [Polyangiaceae bacterium]
MSTTPRLLIAISLAFVGVDLFAVFIRFMLTAAGLPISRWYFFGTIVSLVALALTGASLMSLPRTIAGVLGTGLVAATIGVLGYPWTSRDRFLGDFQQIRPGMGAADVDARLRQYFAGPLAPRRGREPDLCRIYHHSFEPAWNADLGEVCFRDKVVVSTEFYPD